MRYLIFTCLLTLLWPLAGTMEGGDFKGRILTTNPPPNTSRTEVVAGSLQIVTAYSKAETCPDKPCITASGVNPYDGVVACPTSQNFGSQVVINGRVYVCEDRTHPRYDGRYDIWYGNDYKGALQFGKQKLLVKILQ